MFFRIAKRIFLPLLICLIPLQVWAGGTWQVLEPTPTKRTEVAVAELDGKIYLFGGFGEKGISNRVDIFDTATGTWSAGFPMPEALHHTAAVTLENKIYIVGGFKSGMWTPTDSLYEFDPHANRWTKKQSMPTERGALAAGVIHGRLYAIGGAQRQVFSLANTAANESYDPHTDEWTAHAPLPTPRDHFTVTVANDKLYAIGGRVNVDFHNNLGANEVYDPVTDQWKQLSPLPTVRSGITSQLLNGKIYVFGGESGEGTFDDNEAYDPATDKWEKKTDMPKSCHGLGSAVVDNKIHLMTGGPNPGGGGSRYHQVYSE